jgi:hypothetical protein
MEYYVLDLRTLVTHALYVNHLSEGNGNVFFVNFIRTQLVEHDYCHVSTSVFLDWLVLQPGPNVDAKFDD